MRLEFAGPFVNPILSATPQLAVISALPRLSVSNRFPPDPPAASPGDAGRFSAAPEGNQESFNGIAVIVRPQSGPAETRLSGSSFNLLARGYSDGVELGTLGGKNADPRFSRACVCS